MRAAWAGAAALLVVVMAIPLPAASETVGTEVTVANAPPELIELGALANPVDGTVLAWVVVTDGNGGADIQQVTVRLQGEEGLASQEADRAWIDGAEARFEVTLPSLGPLVEMEVTVEDSAGEVLHVAHTFASAQAPLEAQSLTARGDRLHAVPGLATGPLLLAAAVAALTVAGRRAETRW